MIFNPLHTRFLSGNPMETCFTQFFIFSINSSFFAPDSPDVDCHRTVFFLVASDSHRYIALHSPGVLIISTMSSISPSDSCNIGYPSTHLYNIRYQKHLSAFIYPSVTSNATYHNDNPTCRFSAAIFSGISLFGSIWIISVLCINTDASMVQ